MTVSGGRGNAHNATTRTLHASGRGDIKVGMGAREEERRHERCCASDYDEDRSISVFRWLIGRS